MTTDDRPDANCLTRPDGACVSPVPCMHGPGLSRAGALKLAASAFLENDPEPRAFQVIGDLLDSLITDNGATRSEAQRAVKAALAAIVDDYQD